MDKTTTVEYTYFYVELDYEPPVEERDNGYIHGETQIVLIGVCISLLLVLGIGALICAKLHKSCRSNSNTDPAKFYIKSTENVGANLPLTDIENGQEEQYGEHGSYLIKFDNLSFIEYYKSFKML